MSYLDDYEPVADRLARFWIDHPEGRIATAVTERTDRTVVMVAQLWRKMDDLEAPWATGHAMELLAALDKPIEICETSAIGRALANAGYATTGARMTKEEHDSWQAAKARNERRKVEVPAAPQVQRTQPTSPPEDPWATPVDPETGEAATMAAAVATVVEAIPGTEVIEQSGPLVDPPICAHDQPMTWVEGTSKRTGNPYYGWFCRRKNKNEECKPIFTSASGLSHD